MCMHACVQMCRLDSGLALVSKSNCDRERQSWKRGADRVRVKAEGRARGGEGVCLQSHEGDVSTCHIVVITCAAVAARLVVIAVVRRSRARNLGGRRQCRSYKREEDEREQKR